MSKRFIDTDIWRKKWFRKLLPVEKIAFRYIMENCDNVGVWDGDTEVAEFLIGAEIDWDSLPEKTNKNIEILDCGKWWLVDFVRFQHSDLFSGSQSNACKSYVLLLQKHGLYQNFPELFEAFGKPSCSLHEGYKEKEEVKDKERVREKEKDKEKNARTKEDKELMARVKKTFLDIDPTWEDFARETKACYQLIAKAKTRGDPEEVLPVAIGMFSKKISDPAEKDFWREQPMRPSVLNSTAIWSRVCKMIDNRVVEYSGPKLKF